MLWLLFIARIIAGMTAATVPVAQAYVADVTDEKQQLKYFGLTSAAGGLAFIIGQAICGFLGRFVGFVLPSFVAPAVAFTNLISACFFLRESMQPVNTTDSESLCNNLSTLKGVCCPRDKSL